MECVFRAEASALFVDAGNAAFRAANKLVSAEIGRDVATDSGTYASWTAGACDLSTLHGSSGSRSRNGKATANGGIALARMGIANAAQTTTFHTENRKDQLLSRATSSTNPARAATASVRSAGSIKCAKRLGEQSTTQPGTELRATRRFTV